MRRLHILFKSMPCSHVHTIYTDITKKYFRSHKLTRLSCRGLSLRQFAIIIQSAVALCGFHEIQSECDYNFAPFERILPHCRAINKIAVKQPPVKATLGYVQDEKLKHIYDIFPNKLHTYPDHISLLRTLVGKDTPEAGLL